MTHHFSVDCRLSDYLIGFMSPGMKELGNLMFVASSLFPKATDAGTML